MPGLIDGHRIGIQITEDPPQHSIFDEVLPIVFITFSLVIFLIIFIAEWSRVMAHHQTRSNGLIISGVGLALTSLLLIDDPYGSDLLEGILDGAEIVGIGVQARWPLLISVLLVCLGLFGRLQTPNDKGASSD